MAEVTLEQAAVQLGISTDTARRRIKQGKLTARTGDDGRLIVTVPDPAPALADASGTPAVAVQPQADASVELHAKIGQLEQQGRFQDAMMVEKDRHITALEGTLADLRGQVERGQQSEAELRQLLAREQQAHAETRVLLQTLMPQLMAPKDEDNGDQQAQRRPWWRLWRR